MFYNGYHVMGMHLIWWFVWVLLLIWIFVISYRIHYRKFNKDSALDILRKRFASGIITNEEYQEKKKILENDLLE